MMYNLATGHLCQAVKNRAASRPAAIIDHNDPVEIVCHQSFNQREERFLGIIGGNQYDDVARIARHDHLMALTFTLLG
jgi:hypothetical protein